MRAYLALFRIRFSHSLQYRTAALAGISTQCAWGFMLLLSFQAFYRANPGSLPMSLRELSAYIWLQQAFLALYMTWFFDPAIIDAVRSGNIAYDLVRPLGLYGRWFFEAAANRWAKAVLRSSPILLVAFILPEPLRLHLPPSFLHFALFLLSTALALGIVVASSMFVYIAGFHTLSILGLRQMYSVITDFLAGAVLPLPFFPVAVQQVLRLLPFASMQNLPLRLYSGNISGQEALFSLLLQVFWLAVLCFLGHRWMGKSLRRVIVQGG